MKKLLAMALALVMALGVTTMAWADGSITVQIGEAAAVTVDSLDAAAEEVNKGVANSENAEKDITVTLGEGTYTANSTMLLFGSKWENKTSCKWKGKLNIIGAGSDKTTIAFGNAAGGGASAYDNYGNGLVVAINSTEKWYVEVSNLTVGGVAGDKGSSIYVTNINGAMADAVIENVKTTSSTVRADVGTLFANVTLKGTNVFAKKSVTNMIAQYNSSKAKETVTFEGPQDIKPYGLEVKNLPDGMAVAEVGGAKYASLYDAVQAAQNDQTVVLLKDSTETETIITDKNIKIKGDGKALTGALILCGNGTTAVQDMTIKHLEGLGGTVTVSVKGSESVFTFDNVNFVGNGQSSSEYGIEVQSGTVKVTKCTFKDIQKAIEAAQGTKEVYADDVVTEGCEYVGIIYDGKTTVTNSTVNNAKLNIVKGDATITKNTFENNSEIRYYGENVDMKLTENNIVSSKVVIKKTPAEGKTLDLTNNYWGGAAPGEGQITGGEGVNADVVTAKRNAAAGAYKTVRVNIGGEQQPETPPRYYYNSTTTTDTKKDESKSSPKTFDVGVGIYAVSAILSVTGMAYVGKRKF